jgi:hypothetical protein
MIRPIVVKTRAAIAQWKSEPAESKKRFLYTAGAALVLYFLVAFSFHQDGRLRGAGEVLEALERVSPAAAIEIRTACEPDWLTPDCSYFWLLREEAK